MKFTIADMEIDNLTREEVRDKAAGMIEAGEKGFIVTPNASHVVLYQKNPEFRTAYKKASMVLTDGKPLIWASRLLGKPAREKLTGMDLFYLFGALAADRGYSVYFLGGAEDVIAPVVARARMEFERINVCGWHHGYFTDDEAIIRAINEASPDIIFVALGFPRQEKWICRNIDRLNTGVAICVGGIFDILAGKKKRAPGCLQAVGMEWFWRLIHEPRRLWKRYLLGNPEFIYLVARDRLRRRGRRP